MTIKIDPTRLAAEAYRLGEMGILDISWKDIGGTVKTGKFAVTGFGVDGNEQDCIAVAGPYGMSGKNMQRFLVVERITSIKVSEIQSFGRGPDPRIKIVPHGLNRADIEFLDQIERGEAR